MAVVGFIAPWNSPVVLFLRPLAPALAPGCTVVGKLPGLPAQNQRLDVRGICVGEEPAEGVLNVFSGLHSGGVRAVIEHPLVPTVSCTGSTKVGREISAAGAKNLKRFGLELGGKTPVLLFDDANLDKALPVVEKALAVFARQFCMTGSRRLVQRTILGEVRTRRLVMQAFDSEAEAVARANNSIYGLSASVWRENVGRPCASRVRWRPALLVNNWAVVYDETEEGGYKQSGLGASMGSPQSTTSSNTRRLFMNGSHHPQGLRRMHSDDVSAGPPRRPNAEWRLSHGMVTNARSLPASTSP